LRLPRPVTRKFFAPLEENFFFRPPGKMYWTSIKLLDEVQKIWAPLRKLFTPPSGPSWLRACISLLSTTDSQLGFKPKHGTDVYFFTETDCAVLCKQGYRRVFSFLRCI